VPDAGSSAQGSAKTKQEAEKAFQDTTMLEKEVGTLMDQLSAAEDQLGRKKAEADQDMMMAGMVRRDAALTGLCVKLGASASRIEQN
jgi:hypothetical protein